MDPKTGNPPGAGPIGGSDEPKPEGELEISDEE